MGKKYQDSDGNACSLYQMVRREPDWAANHIRAGEQTIAYLAEARAEIERHRVESRKRELRLEDIKTSLLILMAIYEPGQGPDVPRTEIHADLKHLLDTDGVRPK